jgi:hypothetical protein
MVRPLRSVVFLVQTSVDAVQESRRLACALGFVVIVVRVVAVAVAVVVAAAAVAAIAVVEWLAVFASALHVHALMQQVGPQLWMKEGWMGDSVVQLMDSAFVWVELCPQYSYCSQV